MTTITCDRCGSKRTPTSISIDYVAVGEGYKVVPLVDSFDICSSCRTKLKQVIADWLKSVEKI